MAGSDWESPTRDRERAAIIALALSQLRNEAEVRRALAEDLDVTFPTLGEALGDLADLTEAGERTSQRTFALQLLAKLARNRGTEPLVEVQGDLHAYVGASIEEGARLAKVRAARARRADAEAERSRAEAPAHGAPDPVEPSEQRAAEAVWSSPEPAAAPPVVFSAGDDPVASELLAAEDDLSDPPEPLEVVAPVEAQPVAPPGGPPLVAQDPVTQEVFDALNACAASTSTEGTAWDVFAGSSQQSLQLTEAEVHLPTCSDDEVVTLSGRPAYRVITEFTSTEPVSTFSRWTDARTWDTDCSLFYKSVKTVEADAIPDDALEYSELFLEIVRFTQTLTLETPLIFTRSVRIPADPAASATVYALQFRLPNGVETDQIAVDSGSLVVRYDPDLGAVELTAEKAISFKAPAMASWPTLSCDLMWMEMSILAALGCADEGS